jgi:hypothetical protein
VMAKPRTTRSIYYLRSKARLRSWTPSGAPFCTDSLIDQTRVYTADYADGNLRIFFNSNLTSFIRLPAMVHFRDRFFLF